MTRAATIPADSALLCEACGYTLTGVDTTGNCPECGGSISQSSPELRRLPAWEDRGGRSAVFAWFTTAAGALLFPKSFFRQLTIPGDTGRAKWFGRICRGLAAIILGLSTSIHSRQMPLRHPLLAMIDPDETLHVESWIYVPLLVVTCYLLLAVTTHIVVRLTAFEAGYRGLRLPRQIVARALDYHAVHLVSGALLGLLVIVGYAVFERAAPNVAGSLATEYVYTLAGAVVVVGLYLFKTYWTAMKNLMYANRGAPETT